MAASETLPPLLLFLLTIFTRFNLSSAQENAVTGEPFVNCAADAIYVKFKTNATFGGHVNVKFTPNRFCYQVLVTNNQIELLVPHEECAVSRRRVFSPAGLVLEASVAVSFHPEFTTASDRVFHFQCFHKQNSKGLEIGSSTLPPIEASHGPQCSYGIFEAPGGRLAGTVALGQTVFHEWKCEETHNSCLVVRNCALIAGDQRHEIIDGDGCSKDLSLLPQLHYENQSYVTLNVSVFGVSSKPLVFFECELLLLPSLGRCDPLNCGEKRERRSVSSQPPAFDVRSQRIEISELERYSQHPQPPQPSTSCETQVTPDQEGFYVSPSSATLLVLALLTGSLLLAVLLSLLFLNRYRHYNVAASPRRN